MIRRTAACGFAAAMLLFLTLPAAAHEERALHALTVLDAVEPEVAGLEVRVVHLGGPALAVRNESGQMLTVLTGAGDPFLRIGPGGTWMNASSRAAYRSINPDGDYVPPNVHSGKPRWVLVSKETAWTWFDSRLVLSKKSSTWAVWMRLGGRDLLTRGSFESLHGHGHFESSLDDPGISGLEMRLAEGPIPALFVRNETGQVLLVNGRAGEPMLRIGPDGVDANLRSPSYYTSAAQTIARVPPTADAGATPKWESVSTQPVWAWLEYRASVAPELQQRDELGNKRSTVLEWQSPMKLGDRPLDVGGKVQWLPPSTGSIPARTDVDLTPWWILTALVVGLGLVFSSARRNAAIT